MSQFKTPLNAGLRHAAAAYARQKSNDIVKLLQDTMKLIDEEMAANDKIYPHNAGKLNQRELCRRAGISFMTLQSPAHKSTTRVQVDTWLKSKLIVTKKAAAKADVSRADHWKEQHRLVATQICIYELQLKEKDLVIAKQHEDLGKAESKLAQTRKGRVLSIAKSTPFEP
jgi:hypothetical protein